MASSQQNEKEAVKQELLNIGRDLSISESDIQFNAADYFEDQFNVLIEVFLSSAQPWYTA